MLEPRFTLRAMRQIAALTVIAAASLKLAWSGAAQTTTPTVTPGGKQADIIPDSIRFTPAQQGPLLAVGGYDGATFTLRPPLLPQDAQTRAANAGPYRRIVAIGSLTALAPAAMGVIAEQPDKPDPYAGLKVNERVKVLMSLLTEEQWRRAGSAAGIGPDDLDAQERALFMSLLPDQVTVERVKVTQGDQANQVGYANEGDAQQFDSARIRLRFTRKTAFALEVAGGKGQYFISNATDEPGTEKTILQRAGELRGDVTDRSAVTAYGVPILQMVPSRLKPGQLNFALLPLQAALPVDGEAKTVGALLTRIARATGLELSADRRLAGLPIAWRFVPGQTVRASDVLQALCWCVTGAFRKLTLPGGAATYLLTDDVQGIGARMARLNEWALAAAYTRSLALNGLITATAKNDPLAHITYAPGDPAALPPALDQKVNADYRGAAHASGPQFGPEVSLTELPEALQAIVEHIRRNMADGNNVVRTDRLRLTPQLGIEYALPGNLAVDAPFSADFDPDYLQAIAAPTEQRPAAREAAATTDTAIGALPASLRKRVLLIALPEESEPLADLLTAAKGAGFTEVWLHVPLNDAGAVQRLRKAVAQAHQVGLPAGCVVSLLRGGGMPPPEDVNVLGETGTEFVRRQMNASQGVNNVTGRYGGWSVLDPDRAATLLTSIARVPGLSALSLRATAAPGWADDGTGGGGIAMNGELGYRMETRLACIHTEGYDPIDVVSITPLADLNPPPSLPFFPDFCHDVPWQALASYRLRENRHALGLVYTALRAIAPDLPLYLAERASSYIEPNTSWYGLWDAPEHIPVNPAFSMETDARAIAFANSPEPLLNLIGSNGATDELAHALNTAAEDAVKNWRGLTFDLTALKPTDVQRILTGLRSIYSRAAQQ